MPVQGLLIHMSMSNLIKLLR